MDRGYLGPAKRCPFGHRDGRLRGQRDENRVTLKQADGPVGFLHCLNCRKPSLNPELAFLFSASVGEQSNRVKW